MFIDLDSFSYASSFLGNPKRCYKGIFVWLGVKQFIVLDYDTKANHTANLFEALYIYLAKLW